MTSNENTEDKDIVGAQFDPDAQREAEKKLKELKKSNMRAVFGGGVGRLSLIFVGIAFATLFTYGAYKIFGSKNPIAPPPSASSAMIGAPGSQGADSFPASDQEAEMRRLRNQQQAEEARTSGAAYIAPPVLKEPQTEGAKDAHQSQSESTAEGTGPSAPNAAKGTPEEQRVQLQEQAARQSGSGGARASSAAEMQQREVMLGELRQLRDSLKKDEIMPQILVASGSGWKGEPVRSFATSSYTLPDRTKAVPQAAQAAANGDVSMSAQSQTSPPLFNAGDACYGFTSISINTDNPGNDVIASIPVCKGMKDLRVIGKYELKDQAEAISYSFTKLTIPGKGTFPIQAIAINEKTYGTGIADSVDNHYIRRFGVTAVASFVSGMGKAAQIVTGNTTTTSTGVSSQTTTVQSPMTTGRQMKIAAGETAQQIGDELRAQNQNIRPTIIVYGPQDKNKSTGIGIVFLSDVVIDEKK